jgi:hypothetical protein
MGRSGSEEVFRALSNDIDEYKRTRANKKFYVFHDDNKIKAISGSATEEMLENNDYVMVSREDALPYIEGKRNPTGVAIRKRFKSGIIGEDGLLELIDEYALSDKEAYDVPELSDYKDATIVPEISDMGFFVKNNGSVFDHQGFLVKNSPSRSYDGEVTDDMVKEIEPPIANCFIGKSVLYAGPFFPHFGHNILETCGRLWCADHIPDIPLAWTGSHLCTKLGGKNWEAQVARVLGFQHRESFYITEPTKFKQVLVPDISLKIPEYVSDSYRDYMGRWIPRAVKSPHRKVWLSRTALPMDRGRVVQEKEIERTLEKNGWYIFHPEQYELEHQLDVIGHARHISGFIGTAFHLMVFMKDISAKVTIFDRGAHDIRIFNTIAETYRIDQRIIVLPINDYDVNHKNAPHGVNFDNKLARPEVIFDYLL